MKPDESIPRIMTDVPESQSRCTENWRHCDMGLVHKSFFDVGLRLRPDLTLASRVLPSTPPLFQRVERHFLEGQFDGSSVSGIHR